MEKKLIKAKTLNELYSLSDSTTGKEMWTMVYGDDDYEKVSRKTNESFVRYINPFTGKVRDKYTYTRHKCPLCDSKDFKFIFEKHGFDFEKCNDCDLIFTLQVLDLDKLPYMDDGTEGDYYGMSKDNQTIGERDKLKFSMIMEKISKNLESTKDKFDIFDFGSANGMFLDWADSENHNVVGHEFHHDLRKVCESKGHKIMSDDLETITFDKKFDIITCWDYIDHVHNPKKVIENLSKYLNEGGIFFFAINNRDSLSARILHEASPIFIGSQHHMNYGIKQLEMLMKGCILVDVESYVSELNWISNWCNFENPEFGDSPLLHNVFDTEKLCELNMGFKLNAIFRKESK
tara:strand:+ start:9408 stop:10448 length:1041 start_codon:yes stop_codon:yes gene_type:complete